MTKNNLIRGALIAAAAAIALACTTGAPAPTGSPTPTPTAPAPSPSPTATPSAGAGVTSAAQAAARVFASDPRWSAMTPLRADVIGASQWYEAFTEPDGFGVVITAGSGDCMAGCIDQHRWIYHVDPDGAVTLVREEGDEVEIGTPTGTSDRAQVTVVLSAGPVCPVEQNPPDPNCAPHAVKNATVTLFDADGAEVERATSDNNGAVAFEVPAGAYYVVAQPVEGLMGTPDAQAFAILGGDSVQLSFGYDTGIR